MNTKFGHLCRKKLQLIPILEFSTISFQNMKKINQNVNSKKVYIIIIFFFLYRKNIHAYIGAEMLCIITPF